MGGAAQDTQRKAWNDAMRSAAGGAALPPSLQVSTTARRSDRRKKQSRREKARKVTNVGGDANDTSNQDFRAAIWQDALENADPAGAGVEDDEEYDELEELDKKGSKGKRRKMAAAAERKKAGVLPKRFLPRSFASILLEEAWREDSVHRAYLDAEARLPKLERVPQRHFCPVTGLEGVYTEPKSGIRYASLSALEQIRERAPPWMTLTGTAPYMEAVKSLRGEEN